LARKNEEILKTTRRNLMEHHSKLAVKVKGQITRFSNKISEGYRKPVRKWVLQMLYGIQASKDVRPFNIARSLNEPQL